MALLTPDTGRCSRPRRGPWQHRGAWRADVAGGEHPGFGEAMGSVKPKEPRAARMGFQDGFGQSREPEGRRSPERWEEACRIE